MIHKTYRVVSFEQVAPVTLRVMFDDNTTQVIDYRPVLEGELFGPLRDATLFSQVQIDVEAHTLVWPNGPDIDLAILHNWQDAWPAIKRLVEKWASRGVRSGI